MFGVHRKYLCFIAIILLLAYLTLNCGDDTATKSNNDDIVNDPPDTLITGLIAEHSIVEYFEYIPDSIIGYIQDSFNLYYGHTSHGSQLVTGMNMLESADPFYDLPYISEVGDDLGHNGDTSWASVTRSYLRSNPETDIVIWSWCGGCSDNTVEGINTYLNKFAELEAQYPSVVFIYMTGHLDGTGIDGNLYARNNQIRAYCETNNKWLFDFADIESYNPDGTYYPDESDGCDWCESWCATHDCPDCSGCAHSHCYNCYLKGKAFWVILARIAGWNNN